MNFNLQRVALLWLIREYEPISFVDLLRTITRTDHNQYPQSVRKMLKRMGIVSTYSNSEQGIVARDHELSNITISTRDASLITTLHILMKFGLVEFNERGLLGDMKSVFQSEPDLKTREVKTVAYLSQFFSAFNMSLTQILERENTSLLEVTPLFGEPLVFSYFPDIFVAMPFDEALSPVYQDTLKPVIERMGLSVRRGDEFQTNRSVMKEVWSAIWRAELCIADCTQSNANVFYEIGIAHAIGKKTILITQSQDDIPFNIRHLRFIVYDNTSSGLQKLADNLRKMITIELNLA